MVPPDARTVARLLWECTQRTHFDLEMLSEVGFCHGVENYARHLTRRAPGSAPWTLLPQHTTAPDARSFLIAASS